MDSAQDIVQQLKQRAEAPTFDAQGFGTWIQNLDMGPSDSAAARDPTIRKIVGRATGLWRQFTAGEIQRSELQARVRDLAAEHQQVTAGGPNARTPTAAPSG